MRLLARNISIPSRQTVFRLAAALGLVTAFVPVPAAVAQDPYPDLDDIGLVMHVHTVTVAPNLPEESEPPLSAIKDPIFTLLVIVDDIAGEDAARDLVQELKDLREPTPSESDLVIRVKDDRMRVDIGTSALLARLDTLDRSVLEWGVLDPGSGRVVDSDLFDLAVRERSSAPYEVIGGDGSNVHETKTLGPFRTDEFEQIAGHTARRYDFAHGIEVYPLGTDGPAKVVMHRNSWAWIAEDGPYVNDPDAAAVSREFTRTLPPELVQVAAGGLLLGANDTTTIVVQGIIDGEPQARTAALEASSSFRVTHLSREVVDDELLAGFEQDKQECDCSCAAFEELQTLSESDPNVMGKAVCAKKCMPKWMPCVNKINAGGGD